MPLEVQGHTVPHWKALRYGKDQSRGVSYDITLSICQDVLKTGNLLHKQGIVDSLLHNNVNFLPFCRNLRNSEFLHFGKGKESLKEGKKFYFT